MKIPLPPKRYESDSDPKYDPIRTKPWFRFLAERRAKLPQLKGAYDDILVGSKSQAAVCDLWGVDSRELRDYYDFRRSLESDDSLYGSVLTKTIQPTHMAILDIAYKNYCKANGDISLRVFIKEAASEFGMGPRSMVEMWEIHGKFYPTDYEIK